MKGQKPGTYNRMNKFIIGEISSVDMPAQGDGARVEIMKRADFNVTPERMVELIDAWMVSKGWTAEHVDAAKDQWALRVKKNSTKEPLSASSDPISNAADGNPPQDTTMNESEFQAKIDELTKSLAEVTADRDVILKHSKMNDAEKAHYASLEGEDAKTTFLGSDNKSEQIAKAVEVAKALDPVVATTEDGVEILKSQDPTGLLTAAIEKAKKDKKKSKDDDDEKGKLAFLAKNADLAKRAAELTNIPGDEAVRMEMLKAFDAIEDEDMRKAAHAGLIAQNTSMADAFMEKGAVGNPKDQSADEQLDTMAKALMEQDKTTYEVAYTKALMSVEGQEVYNKRLEG